MGVSNGEKRIGSITKVPGESNGPATVFTVDDFKLYPCLCEMLRRRGLSLQPQYTTADVARIFDCDIRVIQEWIHSGKWQARDLPKRGRFLSCDLEAFLQAPLMTPSKAKQIHGGHGQ